MKKIININRRGVMSLLLLFVVIGLAQAQHAKYVFYFIGDGMGVNQVNGTRAYMGQSNAQYKDSIYVPQLLMTTFPVAGLATTHSATNRVTDSAAAGTALACGHKTYNHAIGMDLNKHALESVAIKAKRSGKAVGIATTVSVDHATPAVFYAHQPSREMYYEIACEIPKSNFDFFAGSDFLDPTPAGKPNIYNMVKEASYSIQRGYNNFNASAKKIILLQPKGKDKHSVPYAIDSQSDDLTLTQITKAAIAKLSQNKKGFFVMLEGGKIDWACHANDAATVFGEVKDLDNAVQVAYNFYKRHPNETLIVITADHETGGIALGRGAYSLNLGVLAHQRCSVGELSNKLNELRIANKGNVSWEEVKTLLAKETGLFDTTKLPWPLEKRIRDAYYKSFVKGNAKKVTNLYGKEEPIAAEAIAVLDEFASVSWASHGHSAGLVPVFAIGAGAEEFKGLQDNIEIPKKIAKIGHYK